MIAKGCPRCRSVSNVAHSTLPMTQRDWGDLKCNWCGYLFHTSELVEVEVPGPPPPPKEPRPRKTDPSPFWFDSFETKP
jgi:hypothetical protein